ncbi:hypothetical protein PoB_006494100 [Plakobranchus ocellatus]|uniref:Uncharacterized protein n=1 Tax=Plakobranchus ocellatus TaxID=259542 RepID=A0AAV4D2Y3_9GAST|nr:hypothetical protein PoB_006494100 [Plakobranchus ocellatus]
MRRFYLKSAEKERQGKKAKDCECVCVCVCVAEGIKSRDALTTAYDEAGRVARPTQIGSGIYRMARHGDFTRTGRRRMARNGDFTRTGRRGMARHRDFTRTGGREMARHRAFTRTGRLGWHNIENLRTGRCE